MKNMKINTVSQLIQALQQFDKQLPVSIFDSERGYMSVAFKKEEVLQERKKFQWLNFYAHETLKMYTCETLIGYLSKLPHQAVVSKLSEETKYTSLYLSIDGMRDKGKTYQWLVISDEYEYNRFFRKNETIEDNSFLEQALEKMLQEVKTETSQPIERLHQYLCKQTDESLFKGILTEGKTIKGAYAYCTNKARELAQKEPYAMVEDETVFQWVKDYFISYELPKKSEKKVKKESFTNVNPLSKQTVSIEKGESEQQLDLFATV